VYGLTPWPTILAQRGLLAALAGEGWRPERILTTPPVRRSPPARPQLFRKVPEGRLESLPEVPLVALGQTNLEPLKTLSIAAHLGRELRRWVQQCEEESRRPRLLVYNLGPTHEQGGFLARLRTRLAFDLCPLITDLDDPGESGSFLRRARFRWQARLPRAADRLMALNRRVLDDFGEGQPTLETGGIVADRDLWERLLLLPPPESPSGGPRRFLYAGSLNEVRGIRRLLEAMTGFDPAEARLEVTGGGPLEEEVRARAADLPQVDYLGSLATLEDRLAAFARAEVVVNPHALHAPEARYLWPSKLAEYAASGRCVVSSTAGGMDPAAHPWGLWCESDDPAALHALLRSTLDPHFPLTPRGEAARAWSQEQFAPGPAARRMLEFLGVAAREEYRP
jgi:glycosyltransferase involved in cell wall biosynthesis